MIYYRLITKYFCIYKIFLKEKRIYKLQIHPEMLLTFIHLK